MGGIGEAALVLYYGGGVDARGGAVVVIEVDTMKRRWDDDTVSRELPPKTNDSHNNCTAFF